MRYGCLNKLVKSIRLTYPVMRIIIADDSPKEYTYDIDDEYVTYYRMPEYAGWNAGRGLVISQVETEYFVWCDDDFVFTENTNLPAFLSIIETSGYDVIGGGVGMNHLNAWRSYAKLKIEKGTFEEGFCIKREKGFYGTLPGFANCAVVDLIANFYIARTDTAAQARMFIVELNS